jgi:hypothetical protein
VWIELQRLVFWKSGKKKSLGCGRGFFCAFEAFLRGGLGKVRFSGGGFVVKLWWVRGELWSVDDRFVVG